MLFIIKADNYGNKFIRGGKKVEINSRSLINPFIDYAKVPLQP